MSGAEKGSAAAVDENDIWVCKKCGWTYPNPHPSAKHRRNHRKHCKGAAGKKQAPVQQPEAGSSDNVSSDDEQQQARAAGVVEQKSPTEKQPAVTEESKKTELLKTEEQPTGAEPVTSDAPKALDKVALQTELSKPEKETEESVRTDAPKALDKVALQTELSKPEKETAESVSTDAPKAQEEVSTDAPKAQEGVTPESVSLTSSGPPPAQDLEAKASHRDAVNDVPPATESIKSIPQLQKDLEREIHQQVKVLEVSPEGDEQGAIPLQVEGARGAEGVDASIQGLSPVQEVKKDLVDDHSKAVPLPTHEHVVPDSNVQGDSEKEVLQESVPNSSQQVEQLPPPETGEEKALPEILSLAKSTEETPKEQDTGLATKVQVPAKPQGHRDSWEQLLDADVQGEQSQDVMSKTANDQPAALPVKANDATGRENILNGNPFAETPQATAATATDSQVSAPFVQSDITAASSSTAGEKDKEPDIKPHVALKSLFEDDPKAQEAAANENNAAASTKRNSNVLSKVLDTIRNSPAKVKDNNEARKDEDKPKSRWSSFICCG